VFVLHDDVPDWGEKHKKVKLWKAPVQAFGIRGLIRRVWNNAFGRRATPGSTPLPAEETAPAAETSCRL
jgi:hypothetical protein